MKLPKLLANLPSALLTVLGAIAVVAILWGLVVGLRLIPPTHLTMAAGTKDSAYYEVAKKYQSILARDGIQLDIIETGGSLDNKDLIDKPGSNVDITLIQGGIETSNNDLNALAAVFPEPLLAFAHVDAKLNGNPFSWLDKNIALGAHGSGTRAIVEQLAALTKAPVFNTTTSDSSNLLGGAEASEALLKGELDLAFFVAPLSAPYLQALIEDPSIHMLSLDHGEALASKINEAHYVDLFSGALRYQPAYPEASIPLITLVTKLVARDSLHPALVNRLIHAVNEVHSKRVTLVMSEPFPNTSLLDMKADVYATKLLRDGFNPLEKVLPYWVVAQINRFALLLLPIIFILLPLFKLLPALLAWRMQSRVYRYYLRLHEIDMQLSDKNRQALDDESIRQLDEELFNIEADLRSESLPLKYRESAYNAVHHVQLVRSRIRPSA